jgi:AhpD family alkylhydroperoxidase
VDGDQRRGDASRSGRSRAHCSAILATTSSLTCDSTTQELDRVGFDPRLRELVRIRASRLNGCAYCVDMHTKDARVTGEPDQRFTALPVWRETSFFTQRERAVLAFTESVTRLVETHVPDADYESVAAELSAAEVGALVALLVTINAWNAIGVSARAWEPGSYQP